MEGHFMHSKSLIKIKQGIPKENIYKEDEGDQLARGGGEEEPPPPNPFFIVKINELYTTQPESLVLVMLLEAISADGLPLPPMFRSAKGGRSM